MKLKCFYFIATEITSAAQQILLEDALMTDVSSPVMEKELSDIDLTVKFVEETTLST